jgi:hypothetical protein
MPVATMNFSAQAAFCASCVVPPQLEKTRSFACADAPRAKIAAHVINTSFDLMFPYSVLELVVGMHFAPVHSLQR